MAVIQNIMKTKLYSLILLALSLPVSGFAQASKPLAERQQEFLSWKFGMYIHYGLASYNQGQWATGYEDPATFAPTKLDCGQWADAAKAAGMKYAVFTTKHTSGYALCGHAQALQFPAGQLPPQRPAGPDGAHSGVAGAAARGDRPRMGGDQTGDTTAAPSARNEGVGRSQDAREQMK